jgi:ribosomal protein L23
MKKKIKTAVKGIENVKVRNIASLKQKERKRGRKVA